MTAEVAAMNTHAVALAADSAATLSISDTKQQTYETANKLFSLSYNHPVGIMIYQGLSINKVPWEVIIKMFREEIKGTYHENLRDYAEAFITYLKKQKSLFPSEIQEDMLNSVIFSLLNKLNNNIISEWFSEGNEENPTKEYYEEKIEEIYGRFSQAEISDCFDKTSLDKVSAAIDKFLKSEPAKNIHFLKPVSDKAKNKVKTYLKHHICGQAITPAYTGIVFAGYGTKDIFPAVKSYIIDGFYYNKLKVIQDKEERISHGMNAAIIPFAQRDMPNIFVKGVSPGYEAYVRQVLAQVLLNLPKRIISSIDDLTDKKKEHWLGVFSEEVEKLGTKDIPELFENYAHQEHVIPAVNGIEHLSKQELAEVAESLVNLASLKKRVSIGDDTVGGPVDSAVISKGDGFVWINRKHYFKPSLNPHFFSRYSEFGNIIKSE